MHKPDDRLRQRLFAWSDALMNDFPMVDRETSLRAIEHGVAANCLTKHHFASLSERGDQLATLSAVREDARTFCRLVATLPLLARLRGPDGDLPAVVEEVTAIDDRWYPVIAKTLLARNVDVHRWLAALEGEATDEDARAYVINSLEDARIADLAEEAYPDSGWASIHFPRVVGTGQTRKSGSRRDK